ncbi:MAG: PBSX family phage terminase large subunit [Clostridia bacterium]|nr:PBSX family phage terminase large subunit [Clostridia bacterium]
MANEQNLIPFNKRTESEQRKYASQGGKKSGEVRRQKKAMKDTMKMLLNLNLPESEGKEKLKEMGIEENDLNVQTAILTNQIQRALKGDLDSAKFCRDTSGEYIGAEEEREETENYKVLIPAKDMPPAFINIYRSIRNREYSEYWLEGGRGSIKSTFANEMAIELLENNPKMCIIIIRRYTNTLRDSVYAQTEWTISQFSETYIGLQDDYEFKVSPMEVTKISTGQKIYYRGTDDAGKIKSIKPPKDMYIGVIIYEEFDQIQGMNTVRKINQSIIRGGDDFVQLYVYNTPASRQHFVNKEKKMVKKNRLIYLTDYRSAPKEWLGQAFIDEAEYIKETAPKIYENEYLGLETGEGGNVFENLEIREITDKEINAFDWIYKGIDWGWYPDPFAYNNMYYNSQQRILYIFDELNCNKKSNAETWQMLKEKGVNEEDLITADNAEPKSIGDYRDYGSNIRGAIKGPGSVEYSMKWLSSLNKIVIDKERCPNTTQEFEGYEFEKDKDGNIITGYPDKNNHHIDAVRYALERIWSRRGE